MSTIIEHNSYIDVQDEKGEVHRVLPVTKLQNILKMDTYSEKERNLLKLLIMNSYVVDDVNGKLYKIGSDSGKLYIEESPTDIREVLKEMAELFS